MDILNVDICYRPIRIAWAIRRGDMSAFRTAVRVSNALWGGRFNPIVVFDDPEQAKHIVDTYRADLILSASNDSDAIQFSVSFHHLKNPNLYQSFVEIYPDGAKKSNFLDIQSSVTAMRREEIEALRREGLRTYTWSSDDPLGDTLLIQLGELPTSENYPIDYSDIVDRALQPEKIEILPNERIIADIPDRLTPLVLSNYRLARHYTIASISYPPGFYVGRAGDFDDLVTFWNLRAAGISLWFFDPEHTERYANLIPRIIDRIAKNSPLRTNAHPEMAAWSRQVDLNNIQSSLGSGINRIYQLSDPVFKNIHIIPPMMYFDHSQALGTLIDDSTPNQIVFPLQINALQNSGWLRSQTIVASVLIDFGLLGENRISTRLPNIPELNHLFSRSMGNRQNVIRAEPGRLGFITSASKPHISITAPPISDIFEKIFAMSGYTVKLSNSGLIMRQLLEGLGGLQGARVFKIPGVRRLIKEYGPMKSFSRKSALHQIGHRNTDGDSSFADYKRLFIESRPTDQDLTPADVFSYLVEKGLFRIGADLECPACRLTSWVALDSLQHKITCVLCGNTFEAARQLVKEKWAYRRSGLLGLERNIQGAVPVILTLQQLDANFGPNEGIYSPSLDLVSATDSTASEIDFAWLSYGQPWEKDSLFIGECKDESNESIDEKDIHNLRKIIDSIPRNYLDSYIVLVKLTAFSDKEIAMARSLNKDEQSRVIMLTQRELEPQGIFERTKELFSDIDEYTITPAALANTTKRIYFE